MSSQVSTVDSSRVSLSATDADMPLVSVVISTHNRARLLERAIKSVLAQTYCNIEVVIVDDASSDDTASTVAAIADPRVHYIFHSVNRGGAAARNTGIQAARGEYIAFLDDDDEWDPEKTAEQLRVTRLYGVALCAYKGEEKGWGRYFQASPLVTLDELRRGFFRGGGTSALMARADLMRQTLFDETLPRCQDWDVCIRLAQRANIGYLSRQLVKYNDGDHLRISNKAHGMSAEVLERELRMLRKHEEFFGPRMFRFHMCRFLLRSVKHRADKIPHLTYVCRRYGVRAVVLTFWERYAARTAAERDSDVSHLLGRLLWKASHL